VDKNDPQRTRQASLSYCSLPTSSSSSADVARVDLVETSRAQQGGLLERQP